MGGSDCRLRDGFIAIERSAQRVIFIQGLANTSEGADAGQFNQP